jgi:hypothetical protein
MRPPAAWRHTPDTVFPGGLDSGGRRLAIKSQLLSVFGIRSKVPQNCSGFCSGFRLIPPFYPPLFPYFVLFGVLRINRS